MPIVVDGYNLAHAIAKNFEQFQDVSAFRLSKLIDEWLGLGRDRGDVVFDGTGPRDKSGFENLEQVNVVFSGVGVEADDIIERIIAKNSAPKRLIVVSDDRRLKVAGKKRKCIIMGCIDFWMLLIDGLEEGPKQAKEPREKTAGIDETQTDEWLKEFGL